jgi:hypothetical protein
MQELYRTLAELLTDVSSEKRFNAPENRSRIEKNSKTLSRLAHDISQQGQTSPDRDPSIQILGGLFADESDRAYRFLHSKNRAQRNYARELLQNIPGYCIACHTRTESGPSFSDLPLNPTINQLQPIEKGRFYAATRQFDRALDEFGKVISGPSSASQQFALWQEAVRNSLGIAVRMKQDPATAAQVVNKVLSAPGAPFFVRQDALIWKKSIENWKSESSHNLSTEEDVHAEAARLLALAQQTQKYPADRGADVLYLRASASAHRLLQFGKDAKYTREAYLMAGLCYDVLKTIQLGELHEIYFESCIRSAPHTPLAETCYHRYEQAVYDGFTGSSGTDIPADIEHQLDVLESLALPAPEPTKPQLK